MYDKNDKRSAILNVQRYLSVIFDKNDELPHITVDGIYGDGTKEAVRTVQRNADIEESGRVDRNTFDLIYGLYVEADAEASIRMNTVNYHSYPLVLHDSGPEVTALNLLLSELSVYYELPTGADIAYFSKETEDGVKAMQRIFRLEESGLADAALVKMLRNELFLRDKFEYPK